MKVIFLDIDGVLNDNNTYNTDRTPVGFCGIEDRFIALLKEIIDQTGAIIILCSSWKDFWEDETFPDKKYLDEKFDKFEMKIAGITKDDWVNRGEGIFNYLTENKDIENYVVIDDDIFGDYEEFGILDHLVKTEEEFGITKEDVLKAIEILNKKDEL